MFDSRKRRTGRTISLNIDAPDARDIDVLRISSSGLTAAALYKTSSSPRLCILSAEELPKCKIVQGIHDIAWAGPEDSLFATVRGTDRNIWELIRVNTWSLDQRTILKRQLPNGILLIKAAGMDLVLEENIDGSVTRSLLNLSTLSATPLPDQSAPPSDNWCLDRTILKLRARDGASIPAIKFGSEGRGIILQFYGSYGESLSRQLPLPLQILNEDGFIVFLVGIRGGGECGTPWAKQGSGDLRGRYADDLEDSIDAIRIDYPSTPLVLYTRSAGGLAAAITLHEREKTVSGAILEAPFTSLESWLQTPDAGAEFHLWGDPNTKEGKKNIATLIERIGRSERPVFIWHGLSDEVVPPSSNQRWIDEQLPHATVLLSPDAGHDGPVDTAELHELWAEELAFIDWIASDQP